MNRTLRLDLRRYRGGPGAGPLVDIGSMRQHVEQDLRES